MAKFQVNMPDDFLSGLTEFQFEMIAEPALEAAGQVLEKTMKKAATAAVQHSGESEMVNSIKANKPKKTKTDAYIVNVGPKGNSSKIYYKGNKKRKYPLSNAAKAVFMEYGINSPKHHQAPRPFLEKAKKDAEAEAMEKMQEVYDRMIR